MGNLTHFLSRRFRKENGDFEHSTEGLAMGLKLGDFSVLAVLKGDQPLRFLDTLLEGLRKWKFPETFSDFWEEFNPKLLFDETFGETESGHWIRMASEHPLHFELTFLDCCHYN